MSPAQTQWNFSPLAVTYSWEPRAGSSRQAGGTERRTAKVWYTNNMAISLSRVVFFRAVNGCVRMVTATFRRPRRPHRAMKKYPRMGKSRPANAILARFNETHCRREARHFGERERPLAYCACA